MPSLLFSRSGEVLYLLSREAMRWSSSREARGEGEAILFLLRERQRGGHHSLASSLLFSPLFLERDSPSFERGGGAPSCILLKMQRVATPSRLLGKQGVAILSLDSREARGCHPHSFVSHRFSLLFPQMPYPFFWGGEPKGDHPLLSSREAEGRPSSP